MHPLKCSDHSYFQKETAGYSGLEYGPWNPASCLNPGLDVSALGFGFLSASKTFLSSFPCSKMAEPKGSVHWSTSPETKPAYVQTTFVLCWRKEEDKSTVTEYLKTLTRNRIVRSRGDWIIYKVQAGLVPSLRALTVFPENLGSIACTHMVAHIHHYLQFEGI